MARIPPDTARLMRPEAACLEPYDPAFVPCEVNLSANENDFELPRDVHEAVQMALLSVPTNRYPDPLANDLRDRIASWYGVSRENVFVGNGGDEIIFDFFLAFGGPGHVLLNCPPTFSVYDLYSRMVGTRVLDVWRDPETMLPNVDALVEAAPGTNLAVVTSPNNPTGDLFPLDGVERLLEACPGPVMVDEAYGEFARPGTSSLPLLAAHPNLVVLHTLSKAFGMAGARVGYVIANPGVVAALAAVRQPYSVNVFSQVAAEAVVSRRTAFVDVISSIRTEREVMWRALVDLGASSPVTVWPSEANFLLVRVPHAHELRDRLVRDASILVRDFSAAPGLADCLRITVGTPSENERLLAALKETIREELS